MVTVIPDCVPEKVAYLKERAGTLLIYDHPLASNLKTALSRLDVGSAYYKDPVYPATQPIQRKTSVFP